MAHFVSLEKYVPSPEDDIDWFNIDASGSGSLGLWGCRDGTTKCDVRVVMGPGVAKAGEMRGSIVQVWSFKGLSSTSLIQAFSGSRPFTEQLAVKIASVSGSLAQLNASLLSEDDPMERAIIDDAPVDAVPLVKGIGEYAHSPRMESINGLAVHITGGGGRANGLRATFESKNVSAHFAIDRSGDIAQYVAASIRAQAQGPGDGHFLSVEMVGNCNNATGACQEMTPAQIESLRKLWRWVYDMFPKVPWSMATAYSGRAKFLSNKLVPLYSDMAKELADLGHCAGESNSIPACISSTGLSCHFWLDNAVKPCPGIAIMGQLPEILFKPRVRIAGDEPFILR